jgi:EmrB/QacA subfamily drug resistance transporter
MSRRAKVTVIVSAGLFMASLDMFIVNIAFPRIQQDMAGSSLASLSWILNAYAITLAALLVPAGRLADRTGRRRAFLAGLALFTAASAACAVAPSVAVLVAARVVQAVGAAFLLPTSLGLLLPEYPPDRRGAAVGIWAAVGGVAAAAGPPIGGLLVQVGWRWVFIVNVPIGIAALLAAWLVLTEVRDREGVRPDLFGAALFTVAIGGLTLAIVKGQDWGWSSGRVLGLFAAAAALTLVVAARCTRHPAPLVEPVIVRTRAIALANVSGVLFFCAFGAILLSSVLFLTTVWHQSVLLAGLEIAPGPVMAASVAVPGALLGDRFGVRFVGATGALLFACGAMWLRARAGVTPHYASDFLPAQLLSGAGVGILLTTMSTAATAPLEPSRFATGTAVLGMSRQLGAALGVAVLVAIIGHPTPTGVLDAFRNGWMFVIVCALAAGAAMLAVGPVQVDPERPRSDSPARKPDRRPASYPTPEARASSNA